MKTSTQPLIQAYVEDHADRIVAILQDLVRRPSENRPPHGAELRCQDYIATFLRERQWTPQMFTPDDVPGITSHPLFWPGRDYAGRPNVAARRAGSGGGRSLVLSGHIDTVPVGAREWTRDPFGGEVDGNRLYGRGANDMKCGVAANLFVLEALSEMNVQLKGDLVFESVVDEEFGGVNGTLAGRLMGFNADAAIISEPSFLRVCPAQRGGRTAHITFEAPNSGILGGRRVSAVEQLRLFLNAAVEFGQRRQKSVQAHPFYGHLANPVPANVTRVFTAPWGMTEPSNIPFRCQVEFFWEAMPGERVEDLDRDFFAWLDALVAASPEAFPQRPSVVFPIRWLPGSAVAENEPVLVELRDCAKSVRGTDPPVQGIEGPCDMYVFHEFGIPAVLWGARGGNTHNPDEYVEIDSLVESAKVLLAFVCRWCGVSTA